MAKNDKDIRKDVTVGLDANVGAGDDEVTLEQRFARLEDILSQLEQEDLALDQAFSLYQKGIGEVRAANAQLDAVEKAMLVMNEDGELEEF